MTTPHSAVIGTAGHIDHGKSTLVLALTGTDPDRLPEEKRRGITIDLGFAHFEADGMSLAFVDVPGHEKFVHNMLAGATGIDLVLLVVAADEGVMPQTREHLAITQLLRVPLGLVALTRADLVDAGMRDLAAEDVRALLAAHRLPSVPIIPVSGTTGAGLPELRSALAAAARRLQARAAGPWPRLPIDRVFAAKGFGTVVTGTLQGGELRVGSNLTAIPGGKTARVRGLQSHGAPQEAAQPHTRVAVNLHGVAREELNRGMVLVPSERAVVSVVIDLQLEVWHEAATPLTHGMRLRVHHGTAEVLGRLRLPASGPLPPGATGAAQLRLEAPLAVLPGDRVVLRRYSPVETLAGGEIVWLDPPRWRRLDPVWPARTARLAGAGVAIRLSEAITLAGARGVALPDDVLRLGLAPESVESMVGDLRGARSLGGTRLLADEALESWIKTLRTALGKAHRERPLDPGPSPEALRAALAPDWGADEFRALLDLLAARRTLVISASAVRLPSHQGGASSEAAAALGRIAAVLEPLGLDALGEEELTAKAQLGSRHAEILGLAMRQGAVMRLAGRLVISGNAWQGLVAALRQRAAGGQERVDVATFKELFGLTRRVAIPLLERLDDQGVTQRIGNERRIRPHLPGVDVPAEG